MSNTGFETKVPFWNNLTKGEKDIVKRFAHTRCYEAGSVIHSKEQECLGLIQVISGKVRAFMLSEEGREITLYEMKEDDIDLLSASCVVSQITFETQLVADTDCEVFIIPAVCMAELKEKNLAVRCFIFEKLGERFSDAMHVMQDILFVKLDRRIAQYVLSQAKGDSIKTTHEEIAAKINSSREVVSRMLKEMEKEGIIKLGRGQIDIKDRKKLMGI